ncbi:DNA damage-responsive repressor GIS1/RPH1, jumonji superfamily [Ceraceosorus bombacis]|uniref:DNA damage-responsive repressor GIS1/RPH1, jumonji superfamily n=1 Tax=Ceraceosorus bombacis TaxID=401625 RepID=A0A0P1BGY6_9BASI|nr:DNA damage-responsive repressor GIS1/RPH1, jumonji superfamily [Ceraceosorus bombacis]
MSLAYFAAPVGPHAFAFAQAPPKAAEEVPAASDVGLQQPRSTSDSDSSIEKGASADSSPARPKRAAAALANANLTSPPKASSSSAKKMPVEPAYFYPSDSTDVAATADDGVPVFEPTMEQFADFEAYCEAIDAWGMRSGIVKIIPPRAWKEQLPSLQLPPEPDGTPRGIASIRIRNAISQNWVPAGSGLWRQQNVVHPAKIWNALQWAEVCASEAQRGPEMNRMKANAERTRRPVDATEEDGVRTRSGRAKDGRPSSSIASTKRKRPAAAPRASNGGASQHRRSSTQPRESSPLPVSSDVAQPSEADEKPQAGQSDARAPSTSPTRMLRTRPSAGQEGDVKSDVKKSESKSSSAAPKPKAADLTTEAEWAAFNHETCWLREAASDPASAFKIAVLDESRADGETQPGESIKTEDGEGTTKMEQDDGGESVKAVDVSKQPTPKDWQNADTCREIEAEYWRGLNFGKPPMYGADLKGTLFTPETTAWNVGNLPNILTRLRLKRKLPGVTTPYLYFGMWRATFAWHVEDVDLYSINYIHFGAPKQWYSIRQADKTRFENAMAGAFPSDARRCKHFMRHKSYLASPAFLAAHNIKPLRLVHHAGEFVITYPYGYHSGFNMGFNCAESVNFALPSWLDIGRRAGWCECEEWSVRMDVDAILKESEEIIEMEKKREQRALIRQQQEAGAEVDQERLEARRAARREYEARRKKAKAERLAAEASGYAETASSPTKKARRTSDEDADADADKTCVYCVSDFDNPHVLIEEVDAESATAPPRYAHDLCANFVPETWVETREDGMDVVKGFAGIPKARRTLKCALCPREEYAKAGIKTQCTYGNCTRAAHIGCAYLEATGWRLDVLPQSKADVVEGRKKVSNGKKRQVLEAVSAEQAEMNLGNEAVRHVVLCSTHNPHAKKRLSASAQRNAAVERACALRLKVDEMCSVKVAGHETLVPIVRIVDSSGELPDVAGAVHGSISYFYRPDEERFVKWCHVIFPEEQKLQAAADTIEQPKKKARKPTDANAPKKPRKPRVSKAQEQQHSTGLQVPPPMLHAAQMTPSPSKPLLEHARYAMPLDAPLTPDSSNGTPPQMSHGALHRREPLHGPMPPSGHYAPHLGYGSARYYPSHEVAAPYPPGADSRHGMTYGHHQVPYGAAYAHQIPSMQSHAYAHAPDLREARMSVQRPEDALNSLATHAAAMAPAVSSSARSENTSLHSSHGSYDPRHSSYANGSMSSSSPHLSSSSPHHAAPTLPPIGRGHAPYQAEYGAYAPQGPQAHLFHPSYRQLQPPPSHHRAPHAPAPADHRATARPY